MNANMQNQTEPFEFDTTEKATLKSLIDRLIPADDFPGGWDAGVGDFITQLLNREMRAQIAAYREGLAAIEQESTALFGVTFVALAADRQDALLERIEQGVISTHWPISPAAFFRMAAHHCAEGYYADPGQGGNRERVAWQMIGFNGR